MRAFRLAAIIMACSLVAFSSSTLFAFALNFTSGSPPIGDGEDYPRSINPARQAIGGGVSPGSFFSTIGVSFNNLNGNPAYFDDNNLLTRPATLINNEAFWTDPKFGQFSSGGGGTFELAQFGFDFIPGFTDGLDFGFDLAMASVSTDLPTGSFFDDQTGDFITAPFLPFQVQDDNFNTARDSLVFASDASSGPEECAIFDASGEIVDFRFHSWIITDQSGSFASSLTLSSEIPEPSSALILLMLLGISAIKART